jgi:cell division protein FtsZ
MTKAKNIVIKVIGIGEFGVNAINYMVEKGVRGVDFICAGADMGHLEGNSPLKVLVMDDVDMVFVVSAMGACTGASATSLVVDIVNNKEILSIGLVVQPYLFEIEESTSVINEMEAFWQQLDTVVVIPCDKVVASLRVNASQLDVCKASYMLLHQVVSGIAEPINFIGLVGVDIFDMCCVFSQMGLAVVGTAMASGEGRALSATARAIENPLLSQESLANADVVLVSVRASKPFLMKEWVAVLGLVKKVISEDALVISACLIDEEIVDVCCVTIVATGCSRFERSQQEKSEYRLFVEREKRNN